MWLVQEVLVCHPWSSTCNTIVSYSTNLVSQWSHVHNLIDRLDDSHGHADLNNHHHPSSRR
jgi:hypothetical protein